MIYRDFHGSQLPLLGFGAMRLPLMADGSGQVDVEATRAMIRYGMAHGVNYFDTAYPYHGGKSEIIISEILAVYPRESYYLADKYPGHQICSSYDPAGVFEDQLKKCGVDYFDFYLLHNVCENSFGVYTDPRWGIVDYFIEQKRLGRIRHLGFSTHAHVPAIREFLDLYGDHLDFCQIQMNYLDWTLQDARAKYELLTERSIPVWVMEPVRGGKLAKLPESDEAALAALRPDETSAAWAFRFLQELPNVSVILSGMSSMEQITENVATFEALRPFTAEEKEALAAVAEHLKAGVPCTSCRYCCEGCPMGLDIPVLLGLYNELQLASSANVGMYVDALPADKRPAACIGCGKCSRICPQNIDIPAALHGLTDRLSKMISWAQVCREREEAQKKLKNK